MVKTRTRADIDLRRMGEQLQRHLDRVFSDHKSCESEESKVQIITKEEWELECQKIKVKSLIDQGAYGSFYKGVYVADFISNFSQPFDIIYRNTKKITQKESFEAYLVLLLSILGLDRISTISFCGDKALKQWYRSRMVSSKEQLQGT
ncbi:uncharacterized protein [Nicotiana tomentosiformis]|uniref:uncharacterized protein n=1 Tax=Nicotiana tomentosiformis TaxID=4098 RepID=UPI00051B74DC|nr:uncharacterized protein LOC104110673 [Nicotiana tomentosiformis]